MRNSARKFARIFARENFATKRFGKFSPQKKSPQFAAVSGGGTLLGNERRRPKSEMLRFSQPGRALRRFRATMSAHASNCGVNVTFGICLSSSTAGWQKKEVIMVDFACDNASNRPRKIDPKKSQGPLWELSSANTLECDIQGSQR